MRKNYAYPISKLMNYVSNPELHQSSDINKLKKYLKYIHRIGFYNLSTSFNDTNTHVHMILKTEDKIREDVLAKFNNEINRLMDKKAKLNHTKKSQIKKLDKKISNLVDYQTEIRYSNKMYLVLNYVVFLF